MRALFEHLADDHGPSPAATPSAWPLLGAGVRRTEVAGLRRKDLDTETGRVLVPSKGSKERVTWLAPTAAPTRSAPPKVRQSQSLSDIERLLTAPV